MADEKIYNWSYSPQEKENAVDSQSLRIFDQIVINDDAIKMCNALKLMESSYQTRWCLKLTGSI